jgi:hypothetical protein
MSARALDNLAIVGQDTKKGQQEQSFRQIQRGI